MNPGHQRSCGSASVELVLMTPVLLLMVWFATGVGRQVDAAATARLAADHGARAATMVRRSAMPEVAHRTALQVVASRPSSCATPGVSVRVTSASVTVEVVCTSQGRQVRAISTEVVDVYRSAT